MKKGVREKEENKASKMAGWFFRAARLEAGALLRELGTGMEGLSMGETELRLEKYGLNEVAGDKPDPWFVQLLKAFINPFIAVLLSLAIISLVVDVILATPQERSWGTVAVIAIMVAISGLLSFYQEFRSNKAAEQLEAMVLTTATAVRSDQGGAVEVPIAELVPGDIVQLSAGDMIPADVRILSSIDLFVSQAALTGEAEPVEKYSSPPKKMKDWNNPANADKGKGSGSPGGAGNTKHPDNSGGAYRGKNSSNPADADKAGGPYNPSDGQNPEGSISTVVISKVKDYNYSGNVDNAGISSNPGVGHKVENPGSVGIAHKAENPGNANAVNNANNARNSNSFDSVSILDLENIGFMGTNVVSGAATGVVIATGEGTYFGSLAQTLVGQRARTSFERGVNSVSVLLIRFMLVMVPIVFIINGFTKGDWFQALLFAVSVAVGLTPEMLPMIVTTNLAKGAHTMAKHKTVVKRLSAIQNFGAMDLLCTDKTGTLTLNKVVLVKYLDIHGQTDERVLRHAYLNSFYQTGLKNLLDVAILEFGRKLGFSELDKLYWKVDEIPFDFTRRRMSVVLESENRKRQLVTKGAVEEMLSICSFVEYQGEVIPFTEGIRAEIMEMVKKLGEEGMRVIAVAQKNEVPDAETFGVADENIMVLIGYLGFLDPPKESAKNAVGALREHGVEVKVLTGDNEIVAKNVCSHVGLDSDHVLLGSEIEAMDERELAAAAKRTSVFAKLTPLQKSRIIKALQNEGHTVGFLGDGINDAPALRDSDVGISVDTATDIAKESADIILLEKDLMVLEQGVIEGRNTFGNIIKYIKMTASSNFGNMFSVLAASAFLPFLPMMPIHLLVQNLSYDISQISIPWDHMDPGYIKKPRKWNADDIKKFMIYIGPISSIFDIVTYLVMWYVFKANSPAAQSLFQSGWFVEGLLSQVLIVHMIRTRKIPFFQSRATAPVLILTGVIMAMGVAIPFTSLGASIGLQPLPLNYFFWLAGILFVYSLLTQMVKTWYIKRFGMWL
jgi:Mg2+-importing ATPase